ncbi:MAG: DUF4982 domain-containing protein [Reichenbachiella sp.]
MEISRRNLLMSVLGLSLIWQSCTYQKREFDQSWKFKVTEDPSSYKEFRTDFSDQDWKDIDVPHDWVIEGEYDSANYGTAQATGHIYGGGIGWYRKHFDLKVDENERVSVLFDGVYNNSTVYINDKELGFHPYGYSPFSYDITPYLNKNGKDNLLVVRVDHMRYADSRWYTGAGIYREVKLITSPKVNIPIWGTFVTTPEVSDELAKVNIEIKLENNSSERSTGVIQTSIVDKQGNEVGRSNSDFEIDANSKEVMTHSLEVTSPLLWDVDNPNMYVAKTEVIVNAISTQVYETKFGIRDIRFDPDTGFYLNGENMKIKGVCLHHDAGLAGTAVPKAVWRRRFQTLKDGGCNAIRISHNPGSEEFLDLCDEMGFLVQDEFFDEWDNPKDKRHNKWEVQADFVTKGYGEHFQKWAEKDLKDVILAHRNHPSIIQWSIGNEIEWTYPKMSAATGFFDNMDWSGNYFWSEPPFSLEQIRTQIDTISRGRYDIGETGKKLAEWTREMDTTRPVVANCILPSASHETDYGKSLDIVGYSYRRILYDYGHKNYPDKVIMGTENLAQYHEWKAVMERPWISGTFLWTGIDYLGEIRAPWPKRGTASGLLDYAGFKKPSYHMMKTLWNDDPHIHIATQTLEKSINKIDPKTGLLVAKNPEKWKTALWEWHDVNNHWNYNVGEVISIEVYSNVEELELTLNGKSFGKRKLSEFEDHIYKWAVPFDEGQLIVKGSKGDIQLEKQLNTSKTPAKVLLSIDNSLLNADGNDVAHVIAQVVDEKGVPVKDDESLLTFSLSSVENGEKSESVSPAKSNRTKEETCLKILGVDNGSAMSVQKHSTNSLVTSQGRALLVVQAGLLTGDVEVSVSSEDLEGSSVIVSVK